MKVLNLERLPEHNPALKELIRKQSVSNDIRNLTSDDPKAVSDASRKLIGRVKDDELKRERTLVSDIARKSLLVKRISDESKRVAGMGEYVKQQEEYGAKVGETLSEIGGLSKQRKMTDTELQERLTKLLA
ncbi:hypothetical protein H0N98_03800 [Candidatus Micrarchaeota archaeon]|nr:hypothetical protein [Candidatus Micrarchaeota archaeon]